MSLDEIAERQFIEASARGPAHPKSPDVTLPVALAHDASQTASPSLLRRLTPGGDVALPASPRPRRVDPKVGANDNDGANDDANNNELAKARRRPPRALYLLIAIGACAVAATAGVKFYNYSQGFVATDDAFIAADIVHLSAQTAGRVTEVLAGDNMRVTAGQVLVRLDPQPAITAVQQAQSAHDAAVAQLGQVRAQIQTLNANLQIAELAIRAEEIKAMTEQKQYERLLTLQTLSPDSVSAQQIDVAKAAAEASALALATARQRSLAAKAQLDGVHHQVELAKAQVEGTGAQLDQARRNLSYTEVKAPISGHVARKTVAVGDLVQPGVDLMAIVPLQLYVTANLKETQLASVRAGDPVEIKVDAYPDTLFHGHVDSVQYGAGQAFALLPAENATGNFIKVPQRVPVKIVLDDADDARRPLGPGMSAEPTIKTANSE